MPHDALFLPVVTMDSGVNMNMAADYEQSKDVLGEVLLAFNP